MMRLSRVPVETLCTEVSGEQEQLGLVVDLSEEGLRLQRPLRGAREGRIVQLEFELPDDGELIWAQGAICFDQLWRGAVPTRTSGVRILAAAQRHRNRLRDWVHEARVARDRLTRLMQDAEPGWALAHASHWRG